MFTGLFTLFIEATTTTSPLVTLPPPLLPTLPSTTGSTPGIAGTLRIATLLFYCPLLYAEPRYSTQVWALCSETRTLHEADIS